MTKQTTWRKSSHSGNQNDCVELCVSTMRTGIRDTKSRDTGTLAFRTTEFRVFLAAVKDGELDRQG